MQVWLIFIHVRSRFPLSYSFFCKDPESSSGYLTAFRITTRFNVSTVLYLITVSNISVRPSSTSEWIIHPYNIRSDCGSCVRVTWSNHRTAKALDLSSITRTKAKIVSVHKSVTINEIVSIFHTKELLSFMNDAELNTVVPLKNRKPH